MSKIVCSICKKVHDHVHDGNCPVHPDQKESTYDFKNSDDYLNKEVDRVNKERHSSGLEGLVGSLEDSGPTEKFIYNYGTRTHHLAFVTEYIEETYENMGEDGLEYLVKLIGSPNEGLKQTFTVASPNTLLVNEYIHRYGDFTGFFTKDNVTLLTESTEKQ